MAAEGTGGRSLMLLVLLALHLATNFASAKRTCFMSVRLATKTGYTDRDFDDYVIRGFLIGCKKAGSTCPGKVISHFQGKLGGNVSPIRGDAAKNLCEKFGREVTPADHGEVFARWTASNCDKSGSTYLGRLCCWKYTISSYVIVIPNEGCTQTTKPGVIG
ncbi:uncharacterized protein [Panulirus ornatus]|uniref:uncharacterized protein n=1 Tax=Panulirus ornatus TaxID=150431 RepID=UPI003A85CECB